MSIATVNIQNDVLTTIKNLGVLATFSRLDVALGKSYIVFGKSEETSTIGYKHTGIGRAAYTTSDTRTIYMPKTTRWVPEVGDTVTYKTDKWRILTVESYTVNNVDMLAYKVTMS